MFQSVSWGEAKGFERHLGSGHSETWFGRNEGQWAREGKGQPCLGDGLLG